MIRIRNTDDHDDEIVALDREVFTEQEAHPVELGGSSECWIATNEEDHVVGYAVAYVTEGIGYFDRYGVLPEARGQRVGRRLVQASLRWAKKCGASYMWTYTVPANAESINCLTSCGFQAWRKPDGIHGYCYWKCDLAG